MGMVSEFKEFAVKGNVIDLAVGVIIGGAFGKIVDSIVTDLIMPIVSMVFGRLDFSNWFLPLAKIPPGTTDHRPRIDLDSVRSTSPLSAHTIGCPSEPGPVCTRRLVAGSH